MTQHLLEFNQFISSITYGHPTDTSQQIVIDTSETKNVPVGWVLRYAEFKADATCLRPMPLPFTVLGYDTQCVVQLQKYDAGQWSSVVSKFMTVSCSGAVAFTESYAEIHHEFQPPELLKVVKKAGVETFRFVVFDERMESSVHGPNTIVWYSWGGQRFLTANGITETTPPAPGDKKCYYDDTGEWFESGETICDNGIVKRCTDGKFLSTASTCGNQPQPPSDSPDWGSGLPFDFNSITTDQWMLIGGAVLLLLLMKGKRK